MENIRYGNIKELDECDEDEIKKLLIGRKVKIVVKQRIIE